eukprot:jgi/Bigna1/134547/aug1.25_g9255
MEKIQNVALKWKQFYVKGSIKNINNITTKLGNQPAAFSIILGLALILLQHVVFVCSISLMLPGEGAADVVVVPKGGMRWRDAKQHQGGSFQDPVVAASDAIPSSLCQVLNHNPCLLFGIIQSIALVPLSFFLDTPGKRKIISLTSLATIAGVSAFSLIAVEQATANFSFLQLVLATAISCSLGPMVWIYLPEMLPYNLRAVGCGLGGVLWWTLFVLQSRASTFASLSTGTVFLLLCSAAASGICIFVFFDQRSRFEGEAKTLESLEELSAQLRFSDQPNVSERSGKGYSYYKLMDSRSHSRSSSEMFQRANREGLARLLLKRSANAKYRKYNSSENDSKHGHGP